MSKRRVNQERKAATATSKKQNVKIATGINSMTTWMAVLVFVLPIIYSSSTIDPTIAFRYGFLSVFLLLFSLYFYSKKNIQFHFPPLTRIVFAMGLAYAIWSVLTLFPAISPSAGYYEVARNFLNLLLLFFIYVTVQNEEEQLLRICKSVVLMSMIQSFVGIFQYYDIAFAEVPGANAKPYGLMANRNLFGSAQALVLPFVIYVLYKADKTWRYIAVAGLTGLIISLIVSQTRSAWLASVALFLTSLILVAIFSRKNRKNWLIASGVSVVCVIGLASLLLVLDKENTLTQSVTERAASLTGKLDSSEASGNVNERIKIWKKTVEVIKDKPVLGVGTGNWKIAIPAYGTDNLIWAFGKFIADRPHNIYLFVVSETGFPGGLLFFGSWVLIVIIALSVIRKKDTSEDRRIMAILMLSGMAAFAVDGMFSFPLERIEHSVYLALMGGIIMSLHKNTFSSGTEKRTPSKWMYAGMAAVLLVNLFLVTKKYSFEKHFKNIVEYDNQRQFQDVLDETAAGKNDFVTMNEIGKSFEVYSSVAYMELKDFPKAIEEAKVALRYDPNLWLIYNNTGSIYTRMKDYPRAIENYKKGLRLAPKAEAGLKNLGVNYFYNGEYALCLQTLSNVKFEEQEREFFNSLIAECKRRLAAGIK